METNLTKKQVRAVVSQLQEIRRVIDLSNQRTGLNRCGCPEQSKKDLDNYLNTWVEIPLQKIEQILRLGAHGYNESDLERT